MNEMSLFKTAVVTWVYDILHNEFPEYFNSEPYTSIDGVLTENAPNVYWANTLKNRPIDATECYLDIVSDESICSGTDGKFYIENEGDTYGYYKLTESHFVTVNFVVSSMKNKSLNLTALQAQNLSYNAISYLRMMLKSGSASDYFCYENDYLKNILVCSQNSNMSNITDTSMYEETRNKHTNQFSCKFRFDVVSKRKVDLAQKVYADATYGQDSEGNPKKFGWYLTENEINN